MTTNDILPDFLNEKNFDDLIERINDFDCLRDGINEVFKQVVNRDVTTLVFINNIDSTIIGFCTYCCSSFKTGGIVYPAVELVSFGIDKKYQGVFLERIDGEEDCKISSYVLKFCIDHVENIR